MIVVRQARFKCIKIFFCSLVLKSLPNQQFSSLLHMWHKENARHPWIVDTLSSIKLSRRTYLQPLSYRLSPLLMFDLRHLRCHSSLEVQLRLISGNRDTQELLGATPPWSLHGSLGGQNHHAYQQTLLSPNSRSHIPILTRWLGSNMYVKNDGKKIMLNPSKRSEPVELHVLNKKTWIWDQEAGTCICFGGKRSERTTKWEYNTRVASRCETNIDPILGPHSW